MLSKKTKKYFIKSIRAASFLCAVPYEWNDRLERMEVTTSKRRLFFWSTGFLLEILSESFIIFRLVQSSTTLEIPGIQSRRSDSIAELTNLRYKSIIYMLPVAFQIATLIRWEQLSLFVNFYFRFYEYIQEEFMLAGKWREEKVKNSCDVVMPYIYYLGNTLATLQLISTFILPEQVTLVSSVLENPSECSILTRISFSAIQGYLVFSFCFKMQIHLFAVLSYTSPLALIIKELEISLSENGNNIKTENMTKKMNRNLIPLLSDEIRSPEKFLLIYRCTEFLHRLFNDVFTRIELPCVKGVLISAVILGAYGCVKLEDARILILVFVISSALVSLNATTNCMADLYESSGKVLQSWIPQLIPFTQEAKRNTKLKNGMEMEMEWGGKIMVMAMVNNNNNNGSNLGKKINIKIKGKNDKEKNDLLSRKFKSMRPLTSRISNFYNVKKITVLIVMEFIVETTVNVLIAF